MPKTLTEFCALPAAAAHRVPQTEQACLAHIYTGQRDSAVECFRQPRSAHREDGVGTAEYVLGSASDLDRFVCLLAAARETRDVVTAVREYLAAWPASRVARLQTVDAGWAPFDGNQQPAPVYRPMDVREICDAMHGQCLALRGAGVALTPELLELDLFFFLACTKMAQFAPQSAGVVAPQIPSRAIAPSGPGVPCSRDYPS